MHRSVKSFTFALLIIILIVKPTGERCQAHRLGDDAQFEQDDVHAGFVSQGMCCGEDELGISDDHTGLMVIDSDAPLGTDIKSIYAIDDIIFEVDNKSLTNRPDLWGHYGIAREFAVIANKPLLPLSLTEPVYSGSEKIDVDIKRPDIAWRYTCVGFKNITRKLSPTNWRIRLFYCGMRAISLLVDITNLIMLEMGQPTHAFDGTGIKSIAIGTEDKEYKFKTLDEVERTIDKDTLMIYTNGKPSAIAGIIIGKNDAVQISHLDSPPSKSSVTMALAGTVQPFPTLMPWAITATPQSSGLAGLVYTKITLQ